MSINCGNLPAQLRETGLFCCWRYEQRGDKPTKCPYNPRTGGGAQSTNPATFAPLAVALDAMERGGYDGIGVGIFGNLGAIDIDHCLDDAGKPSELARDIAGTIHGYTERSPSGKGLRILFTVPAGFQYDKARYYINNQKRGLEVYISGCTNKYVTVTGNAINPGYPLEERGEQLAAVLEKYMVRPRQTTQQAPREPVALDDLQLIEKAKRSKGGPKFTALWSGDASHYNSRSEADQALCNILAFWTNRDPARMDRLFRQSGLMREKWDRRQSGSTYGALTIQRAIADSRSGYEPQARPSPERNSTPTKGTDPVETKPKLVRACDVPYEPPRWTIAPYFQRGKGTLVQGDNGTGKTAFLCAIAAHVTTGEPLLGLPIVGAGDVIFLSTEDDLPVLRGRIEADGGDLTKLHFMTNAAGLTFNSPEIEAAVMKSGLLRSRWNGLDCERKRS